MILQVLCTGSDGNAYVLEHDNSYLMLDCGGHSDDIYRAVGYNTAALSGCLVSHEHKDHSKNMEFLRKQFVDVEQAKGCEMGVMGDWKYFSFDLEHDVPNVGYIIQNKKDTDNIVCYITDTGYIRYNPIGVRTYIIECNFVEELFDGTQDEKERRLRVYKTHLSLKRLLSFLDKADLSNLNTVVLVHLSDKYSDEQMMIDEVKKKTGVNVYAAHAGDVIDLNIVPF